MSALVAGTAFANEGSAEAPKSAKEGCGKEGCGKESCKGKGHAKKKAKQKETKEAAPAETKSE